MKSIKISSMILINRNYYVNSNLQRARGRLGDDDFAVLARVIPSRRRENGFLLTAWVFLPDPPRRGMPSSGCGIPKASRSQWKR